MSISFNNKYLFIYSLTSFLILIFCFFVENSFVYLKYIGIFTILLTLLSLFEYRKSKGMISWVIVIVALINICWANSICFFPKQNAFYWQVALVESSANVIMAKCYIVFYCFFLLGLSQKYNYICRKEAFVARDNIVIFCGLYLLLLYILIFGFSRNEMNSSYYVSQSNPIYEYAVLVYIACWLYSGKKKFLKSFLLIYAMLYVCQGIIYGDRSSAFPMLLVVFILLINKDIPTILIVFVGLVGLFMANIIGVLRNGNEINILDILQIGLNLNTISYSHYAGVQIINYGGSTMHIPEMLEYLFRIIIGGNNALAITAANSGFYNTGGGFSSSHFYFWGNYIGVIFGGLLFGIIIKCFFSQKHYNDLVALSIIAYSIRWYLYYPVSFFRSSIVLPLILSYSLYLFNTIFYEKDYMRISV